MDDAELYRQILGIPAPWGVLGVRLSHDAREVVVKVGWVGPGQLCCPECGKPGPGYDTKVRRWRHLDTCQYTTFIEGEIPRLSCPQHGVLAVAAPWAEKGSRYTALFETLVIHWLKDAPVSAVARNLKMGWAAVEGVRDRAVRRGLARRGQLAPKDIGVDETSAKRGHHYLTVVSEGSRVLYVAENRDKAAIDGFWGQLAQAALAGLRSVSVDLWPAFLSSIRQHVPGAEEKMCLDRFHVAGYFAKALDQVRRKENRELLLLGDEALKGTKYHWLRSDAKVDNRSRRWFTELARSSLKTARAWAIKETAHRLWGYVRTGVAKKAWQELLGWMTRCRMKPMVELASSIRKNLPMILNAIRLKASNGHAESNNSRIQKIKKMACGFRSIHSFKNAIYFHLGGLDLLPTPTPAPT